MKKFTLSVLLLFISFTFSYGAAVSVEIAKTVGYNYLLQHGETTLNSTDDLRLVYTSGSSTAMFYVFNGNNCFVIVSADDAVVPVLGYSKNNLFKTDNLPANITDFLEGYNKQINYVINNSIAATPEIATTWDNLVHNYTTHSVEKTTIVSPLLSTTWDQYPYYNADCPADAAAGSFGGHDVTGCVATAMAQVMKFWNWPTHGAGIHSYTTSSYGTLSANFGSTTYNWAAMPNNVTSANPSVARLMSDVGISVNMNYTPTESGAYVISSATGTPPYCAEYSLKTFFNYASTLHGESRASYSDATWISMLEADLNAGRPIICSGTGTSGGHCFVFDGYDASSNFHVNWGWSGSSNGYYSINALNPPSLGTGGGGGGFNSNQTAILGIQPNVPPTYSLQLYDYVNLSASTIGYYNPFTVTTNVYNTGSTTFTGDFCAAAFDATTGNFITFVDSVVGWSLPAGMVYLSPFISLPTTGLLAMLPGTYVIGVYYRPTGGSWVAISNSGSYTNFVPMTVVNHNYMQLYSAMIPTPTIFVQGSAASVNLNIYNTGASAFTGSYDLSLYHLDGTFACGIQTMTGMALPAGNIYLSPFLTFSTTNITAPPGTYFLAMEYNDGSGWALAGTDYFQNPIYITVVAPPLSPDIYEVNNTSSTAYNLSSTLTWVSNIAHTSTTGSNFHIVSDQDYYKIVLPSGYNYSITARVNDLVSTDDGLPYTIDAVWSYSIDGGATWSSVYNDVMPGTINFSGYTGGTVIFHVSPHYAGNIGTYLLKIGNITRTPSATTLSEIVLTGEKIFPNPASDFVTVDLSGTEAKGIAAIVRNIQGKVVFSGDVTNQSVITIPLNSIAAGMYLLEVTTDAGMVIKKITVRK